MCVLKGECHCAWSSRYSAVPQGMRRESGPAVAGFSSYVGRWCMLLGPVLIMTSTALGKPVPMSAVAKSILYLASEAWSGCVTGQVLNVDGGKQGKVMWMEGEIK